MSMMTRIETLKLKMKMQKKGFDKGVRELEKSIALKCYPDKRLLPLLTIMVESDFETVASCSGHKSKKCRGTKKVYNNINGYIDFRIHKQATSLASITKEIKRQYPILWEDKFWRDLEPSKEETVGLGLYKFPYTDIRLFRLSWSFETLKERNAFFKYLLKVFVDDQIRRNKLKCKNI